MDTQKASLPISAELVSHEQIPTALKNVSENGKRATKLDRIIALMKDNVPRTPAEIAKKLDIDGKLVRDYLRKHARGESRQLFRTVDHKGKRNAARYVLGAGPNVGTRRALDPNNDADDAALDARYRKESRDWPVADVLVISSMDAMVRSGARA